MSILKAEVELFFRRNPALCEREDQILTRLPDAISIPEYVVLEVMGETLFKFLKYDKSNDAPLEGVDIVRKALEMMQKTLASRYIDVAMVPG